MKKWALMAALGTCLVLTGCSTAGPFVTNISSDGRGNLIIEKNMVRYNSFTGTIGMSDDPVVTTIRVSP